MEKKSISPAVVIGALVALAAVLAGVWALTMRPKAPEAKAEYAPAYTRGQGAAPYGPQSGAGGAGATSGAPAYGRPGGSGGPGYGGPGYGAPGGSPGYGQPPGPR